MNRLIDISKNDDILSKYRQTPIELLLEYHNLNRTPDKFTSARLLIGMCVDNRLHLRIPDNFSFIVRSGGGNLRFNEFKISYAISVGGIKHIALIGHTNCGMVNLKSRKTQFVNGLIEKAGWDMKKAEEHFLHFAPTFEIGNEVDFVLSEAKRLRVVYPKIVVAPMLYKVEDSRLYLVNEK